MTRTLPIAERLRRVHGRFTTDEWNGMYENEWGFYWMTPTGAKTLLVDSTHQYPIFTGTGTPAGNTTLSYSQILLALLVSAGCEIPPASLVSPGVLSWYTTSYGPRGAAAITVDSSAIIIRQDVKKQSQTGRWIRIPLQPIESLVEDDGTVSDPVAFMWALIAHARLDTNNALFFGIKSSPNDSLLVANLKATGYDYGGDLVFYTINASVSGWQASTVVPHGSARRLLGAVLNHMLPGASLCPVEGMDGGLYLPGLVSNSWLQMQTTEITAGVEIETLKRPVIDVYQTLTHQSDGVVTLSHLDPPAVIFMCMTLELDVDFGDVTLSLDGIANGVIAIQDNLATVGGNVNGVQSTVNSISDAVTQLAVELAGDYFYLSQMINGLSGQIDALPGQIDLTQITNRITDLAAQLGLDAQILTTLMYKLVITKVRKRDRAAFYRLLCDLYYHDQGSPTAAGSDGGVMALIPLILDVNGKPIIQKETIDGSNPQH